MQPVFAENALRLDAGMHGARPRARLGLIAWRTDYDVTWELSDDITEWEIPPIIILQ